MREHGYEEDEFPEIYRSLVEPADIIILAGPIWLGDQSSQTRISSSACTPTPARSTTRPVGLLRQGRRRADDGNEDGGKHVSAQVLYALQHIGLTIPPQSDSYWVGEAGPGPSYLDAGAADSTMPGPRATPCS